MQVEASLSALGRRTAFLARRIVILAGIFALAGCAAFTREQYTKQEADVARVPGIADARVWADDTATIATRLRGDKRLVKQMTVLALSGGGPDGAFGAGLLVGWSQRGNRPQFSVVTGASAGALIAPFAFLGPTYDPVLVAVFKGGETKDLLQTDLLGAVFGTGLFEAGPLHALVARYVDEGLLAAVAQEYRKGRRLYVVTTDIDSQRTAIWDMGRIAASGDPHALALFREILVASASIPGVFPPALINVEANGRRFAEMHVDGGVTANVLIVPEGLLASGHADFAPGMRPKLDVIINGKLTPYFEVVPGQTIRIVARSFQTAVRANTQSTLLASYEFAKRRGWQLNVAAIEADYPEEAPRGFDQGYTTRLFQYGQHRGAAGHLWETAPSDLSSRREMVSR